MNNFRPMIKAEIDSINYLIGKYEDKPHKPAKGTLCYSIQNNEIVYYLQNSIYEDGKRKRTAIMLGDIYSKPVQSIKLNRFNYEMLRRLRTNKKLLEKIDGKYMDISPFAVHKDLPSAYKDLPKECYIDDSYEELKAWAAEKYEKNSKEMQWLPCITVTGESVRSKGEAIIYNMLVYYGIPFKYDSQLTLIDANGYKVTRYPDFAIQTKSGQIIYWEHLGRLEKEDYFEGFCEKFMLYHLNGICAGDNLIITADRIGGSINTKAIDDVLRYCILPLVR